MSFRISFHRIDHGTTRLTQGLVYGLDYDRLTPDTEVKAFEFNEQNYYLMLTELLMKSPKFTETNWDWSAPDFSLPFHITVNDLAAMMAAHKPMRVALICADEAPDFPVELVKLYHEDMAQAGTGVLHYAYFEHCWEGHEAVGRVLDTFRELHG